MKMTPDFSTLAGDTQHKQLQGTVTLKPGRFSLIIATDHLATLLICLLLQRQGEDAIKSRLPTQTLADMHLQASFSSLIWEDIRLPWSNLIKTLGDCHLRKAILKIEDSHRAAIQMQADFPRLKAFLKGVGTLHQLRKAILTLPVSLQRTKSLSLCLQAATPTLPLSLTQTVASNLPCPLNTLQVHRVPCPIPLP